MSVIARTKGAVHGFGPCPSKVMIVGKKPGRTELARGIPFCGPAGYIQRSCLKRYGINVDDAFVTNYQRHSDDEVVSADQYNRWLEQEIEQVEPELIITAGTLATKWFLGERATVGMCHGLVHKAGCFDESREGRGKGAVIFPIYNPAMWLWDVGNSPGIEWSYQQASKAWKQVEMGLDVEVPFGKDAGVYQDIGGVELAKQIKKLNRRNKIWSIGLDTEGVKNDYWSIQLSAKNYTGWVLRTEMDDFYIGRKAIQKLVKKRCEFVMHYALHDMSACREMGLNIEKMKIFDTMYAAYLLGVEPQGLKDLAWRWCRVAMDSYMDIVGEFSRVKQIEYLKCVESMDWGEDEKYMIWLNNGMKKLYKPQGIDKRAKGILRDIDSRKKNKDGELTDPMKRWKNIDIDLRWQVEFELGVMPIGTLADSELVKSVDYAGRDADVTRRVRNAMMPELERQGLLGLIYG